MKWYAAHIIMSVKLKVEPQQKYPVWENIVIVKAENIKEAWAKAIHFGKAEEGDSFGTFTWDKKPATWVFAGIRKLIECEPSVEQCCKESSNAILADGTEITYSQLEVENEEALQKLVKGDPVLVLYEE